MFESILNTPLTELCESLKIFNEFCRGLLLNIKD